MVRVLIIIAILGMSTATNAQLLVNKLKIKFLALGDSYTIGESVEEKERWPNQLADSLLIRGVECVPPLRIIATTGWRTDQLKAAIKEAGLAKDYDLVSLLIGVNNEYQNKTPESYKPEFEELLKTAVELAGGDKMRVFVVSIPDYGFTPFGKQKKETITKRIDLYNMINRSVTEKAGITYISITDISRKGFEQPDLVASDGLHPSGKMYSEWVKRILEAIDLKLGNKRIKD
jgi:lysophospholipase L1-like esterase